MKVTFWTLLLLSFQAAIATTLLVRNHNCAPSAYTKICILVSLHYKPNAQQQVIHNFPSNQSHIRIVSETRTSGYTREVLDIDAKLYALLGQPAILEVFEHAVWNLQIPRALKQGSFPHSYVKNLTVEPGTDSPALQYLDLTNNYLSKIANIASLINLEVLRLGDNLISSINPSTFENLTKLRHLDLSYNDLRQISTAIFPQSLIHLNLYKNHITSLNYANLNYPSLEVLNLERNQLARIDGPSLILAMPSLKQARIAGNPIETYDLQQTLLLFQRHNITFRNEADEATCWSGEQIHEGVCVVQPKPPRTVLKDVVMSLAVVLVAIALVATLRWVILAMGRK